MTTKNLQVLAGEGRYMTQWGSRERGEVYENLPARFADELLRDQPGAFQEVKKGGGGQWQPVADEKEEA